MEKKRLTVGCRARILPPGPKNKKDKRHFEKSWCDNYPNREVLLIERSLGGNFAVLLLISGENVPLTQGAKNVVDNQVAWISEEDMELVDADFNTNLDFIDWYQEHEECYCPDCGEWGGGEISSIDYFDFECPNKKCPSKRKTRKRKKTNE